MQNDSSGVVAALAVLAAALLLAVAQATGVLLPMDRLLYPLLAAATQPPAPTGVLHQCNPLPGHPWPRQQLTQQLEQLTRRGVGQVGLLIDLSAPDSDDGKHDARLAAAIRRAGNVVLSVTTSRRGDGTVDEHPPLPLFANAAVGSGHTEVVVGGDGIVRLPLLAGVGTARYPTFAALLTDPTRTQHAATAAGVPTPCMGCWQQGPQVHVAAGQAPLHRAAIAEAGRARTARTVAGIRVVIGEDRPGRRDCASRVALQVRAMATLEGHAPVRDLPPWAAFALTAGWVMLAAGLIWRSTVGWLWLAAPVGPPLFAWAMLLGLQAWWSPVPALLGNIALGALHGARWWRATRPSAAPRPAAMLSRLALEAELQQHAQAGNCGSLLLITFASHVPARQKRPCSDELRTMSALWAWLQRCPHRPADRLAQWGDASIALWLPGTGAYGAEQVAGALRRQCGSAADKGGDMPPGLALAIGAATAAGPLPWSARQLIDCSQDCLRQAMDVRSAGWAACTLPGDEAADVNNTHPNG